MGVLVPAPDLFDYESTPAPIIQKFEVVLMMFHLLQIEGRKVHSLQKGGIVNHAYFSLVNEGKKPILYRLLELDPFVYFIELLNCDEAVFVLVELVEHVVKRNPLQVQSLTQFSQHFFHFFLTQCLLRVKSFMS